MKRGILAIHSCPMALIRHVEWSIESVLGNDLSTQSSRANHIINFRWRNQPLIAGTQRTEVEWRSKIDYTSELASALKGWHYLRFEITFDNQLFRHTPDLGLHRATIDEFGNICITENQIKSAMSKTDQLMREQLDVVLGTEWEMELERFRGVDLQEIEHLRAI